jgi:DNA-binding transcriptional regulator GbsR (MarR family)
MYQDRTFPPNVYYFKTIKNLFIDPITKEIEEAKTQITEMKEKALGDIQKDPTNKKEIADKQIKQIEDLVKGIRTRVEGNLGTGRREPIPL